MGIQKMRTYSLLILLLAMTTISCGSTKEGLEWLANKAKEDGVHETPSGLLYKVIKSGEASAKSPLVGTPCSCHYRGTLINGKEFDSSYRRGEPTTFAPNQVISGWTEAMQMMREGDHWELYIKSELAYGDRGAGGDIRPGATLIFELELLKVLGQSKRLDL